MGRHKKVHEVAPQPPEEVDARYKQFKLDLLKHTTSLNALRQRWAPQTDDSFAAYCRLNQKALVQYDTMTTILISGELNGKKATKQEIQKFLLGADCAELRKHLGDNSVSENNHSGSPTKDEDEPTPQETTKVEKEKKRSQPELDSDKVEPAEAPKKIKLAAVESKQSGELLIGSLKVQMHSLNEEVLRLQNELQIEKNANAYLAGVVTNTVQAFESIRKDQERKSILARQAQESSRKDQERKINLTTDELEKLKVQSKSFVTNLCLGHTSKALSMLSDNRLVRQYYYGTTFDAPGVEYYAVPADALIRTVNTLSELINANPRDKGVKSDCFIIMLQLIENNIELFNYFFNGFGMAEKNSLQDTELKIYKLEDNPKILVNLFTSICIHPKDACGKKIIDYLKQSKSLLEHLERVVSTVEFESVRMFILTLPLTLNKVQPVMEVPVTEQPPAAQTVTAQPAPSGFLEAYLLSINKGNQQLQLPGNAQLSQKSLEVVSWKGVGRNPQPSAKDLADEILDLNDDSPHSIEYRSNGSSLM